MNSTAHIKLCYAQNKLTHTITTNSYNTITQLIHYQEKHTTDFNRKSIPPKKFQFFKLQIHFTIFLNFTFCIKDTNLQGIVGNYDPIRQMYIVCPLTRTFNVDESRPLIFPHEYIRPVEMLILEYVHNLK